MEQPYEQPYNEIAEQVGLHTQNQQGNLIANQSRQLQYQMEKAEQNLAESQLECLQTLERLEHEYKQDIIKVNKEGFQEWGEISNKTKRNLTEEGVNFIMSTLRKYVNKETLLSNFDEKTIMRRMLNFSKSFNDNLFMKLEIYFRTPTLEECYNILQRRKEEKIQQIILSNKLLEKEVNEEEIRKQVLKQMEEQMESEIQKIKKEYAKINLKSYGMIWTECVDLVESTHNRAWKGEERGSLRRHFNISEVIGGRAQMPEKKKWGLF